MARGWLMALAPLLACQAGVDAPVGLREPIVVHGAQLHQGSLPLAPNGPAVTSVDVASSIWRIGSYGRPVAGRVGQGATAVALRLDDAGSGPWVLPLLGPDPLNDNELTFRAEVDLAHDVTPGIHVLLLRAVDVTGASGPAFELKSCVPSPWPDNLNACNPKAMPPDTVVTVTWNSDADLDLTVRQPDGAWISGKSPLAGKAATEPTQGRHERDIGANCAAEGVRRESISWPEAPAGSLMLAYLRPFAACGTTATTALVQVLRREAGPVPETWRQVEVARKSVQFLASEFDGGAQPPIYVLPVQF
jgi:hypothetical protein